MISSHIISTSLHTSGSAHLNKRKCKKTQSITVSKPKFFKIIEGVVIVVIALYSNSVDNLIVIECYYIREQSNLYDVTIHYRLLP